MALQPVTTTQFKKDAKKQQKRGKDMSLLKTLIALLVAEQTLPPSYKDHPLTGNWAGYRDAHIEPDWLLLYKVQGDELLLTRTGTHSDLFR